MKRQSSNAGFTLLELISAMAVGSIVLMMAVAVLGQTGDGYERIGGGISAEREARAVLTQVSADLGTAQYHDAEIFERNGVGWGKDRIGFLTLQPQDAQSTAGYVGDLCAVHYYVKDLVTGGRTVRCLMRGFRESKDTFDAVKSGTVSSLFAERPLDEPIAFGVVSFKALPKVRDASGRLTDWSSSSGKAPNAVDLLIVIARKEMLGKLRSPADWDGGGQFGKMLGEPDEAERNRNLQTFGSLIRFGNNEAR